ncbi:MAG TPA: hypothetical protein VJY35_07665 [Candidatus Eisenbacteria bacterium]|nr:hypothetical protein [Candidatus Eisenbacteria bacterium]
MRRLATGLGLAITLLCATSHAHGQKATEQYIPIGQSPGISGKYTSLGVIAEVNLRDQTITIADPAGAKTVKITGKSRIFLDRTPLKLSNLRGVFADLQKGRRAEVKYLDPDRRSDSVKSQIADWVKVEITQQ